jgi:hypothetical protein
MGWVFPLGRVWQHLSTTSGYFIEAEHVHSFAMAYGLGLCYNNYMKISVGTFSLHIVLTQGHVLTKCGLARHQMIYLMLESEMTSLY